MQRLIKRVIRNRSNGQLLVTIPKDTPNLQGGDYVELIKIPDPVRTKDGNYVWRNQN